MAAIKRVELFLEIAAGTVFGKIMGISDRVSAFMLRCKGFAWIAFFLITAGFVVLNHPSFTRRAGVLDDTLPKDDPVRIEGEYVQQKTGWDEFVLMFVRFEGGIREPSNLEKIREWTEKAMEVFGLGVLSVATYPDFIWRGSGEEAYADGIGYIPKGAGSVDVGRWKESVMEDPAVYGKLVARDFSWAMIAIPLREGYDEFGVFFKTAELVEERSIPQWERWLGMTDIRPKDPDISVGSWVLGRATIHLTLTLEMIRLIAIGIIVIGLVSCFLYRSVWQTAFSIGLFLASIVWTRGTIGLLSLMGFHVNERVFILAVFTNCIVQGVSFGLHKLEEFNRSGSWDKARRVDGLLFETSLISVFGFITLVTFRDYSIREMGVLSGIGIIYLYVLAAWFLPAMAPAKPVKERAGRMNSLAERLASGCYRASLVSPKVYLCALVVIVGSAAVLIWKGYMRFGSTPYSYIPGKHVEQTARWLNGAGNIGGDALNLFVEPAGNEEYGFYGIGFIRRLSEFQDRLIMEVPQARMVSSVADSVRRLSEVMYGKPLPESQEDLDDLMAVLEGGEIAPELMGQMWTRDGARLSVFAVIDNSLLQARLIGNVMKVSSDFPGLKVSAFGKVPVYNRQDSYIVEGKPRNVLGSQFVVVFFCFLIIARRSRAIGSSRLSPWKGSVVMSSPFVFASGVIAIIMVAFGIALDVASAVISALAINASIDFSIYFVRDYQKALKHGDRRTAALIAMREEGTVVIKDVVLNALCFAPLYISDFLPIARLGWMMGVMIFSCGIGSLIIMPSFLRWAVRKEAT